MVDSMARWDWSRVWPSRSRRQGEAFGGAKGEPEDEEMRRAMRGIQMCLVMRPAIFLTESPYGQCADRTSGRTCAARCGPACCAETCWSGSCGACSPRMQASPRCAPLREPFLLADAVTEKRSGRGARRNPAKNSAPLRLATRAFDPTNAKAPRIRALGAISIPNRPQLGP
jgi:hypothetical protein